MHELMSERARSGGYLFFIMLAAMGVRILVGLIRPELSFEQSILVGLTTVVFLSPPLFRFFHGKDLLDTKRKRIAHGVSMGLASALFLYYIALA